MDYYTAIASSYEALHKEEQLNKLRLIKDHLQLTGKEQILDIGCGPCWSADFFPSVVGIDPSFGLLDKKKRMVNGITEQLPFKDHSFDVLLCITAVHHFDIARAFAEMKRVGKGSAVYIITVLKKAQAKDEIMATIYEEFTVHHVLEEEKDLIFFLTASP